MVLLMNSNIYLTIEKLKILITHKLQFTKIFFEAWGQWYLGIYCSNKKQYIPGNTTASGMKELLELLCKVNIL